MPQLVSDQNGAGGPGFWQLLATFENLWQIVTTFGNLWQFLTYFGNFLQLFATVDILWQLCAALLLIEHPDLSCTAGTAVPHYLPPWATDF